MTKPKYWPICGFEMEDGYCINCGYDAFLDAFPEPNEAGKTSSSSRKGDFFDDILDILGSESKDDDLF